MSQEYEIQRSIGIGSFGQVFLASKKRSKEQCVIKKIKIGGITEVQKKNIENQVKLLQDLKHINIVGYKDSFMDKEGYLNIVMENCQGGDMYHRIKSTNGRRFEENEIIDWFIQISLALLYMHQKKILHRDLKTQNIFLTGGKVRLGDFGISKVLDEKQQLTNTVIGTPYYMSPEQFRFKPYNYKTDIWALGCLLYEMCNLKHAFDAQNLSALSVKVLKGNYPPVSSQYSSSLRDLVSKLLSINCKDRPTILQILKMPFLRKRLAVYIQACIKENANKDQIQSLVDQAKILGLQFLESSPAQISHDYTQIKSERTEPQNSSKITRKSSRQILDKKGLENRKRIIEKQLDRQEKEKGRLQTQFKKEDRLRVEKRQEILDRDKERRNQRLSQQKLKSDSTPNLLLMKVKREQVTAVVPNHQLINQSKSIPIRQVPVEENLSVQYNSNVLPYSSESKEKAFKMEEEYDMNFDDEEVLDNKQHQTIYQILEMEEEEPQKPKESIIPSEIEQNITNHESIQIADVRNIVNAVKEQLKTKTQRIDSLKSELLNINFEISQDSIHESPRKLNPKYQKIQDKIHQMKERIESQIGNKKYEMLRKLTGDKKENMSLNEHEHLKESVLGLVGKNNLGYWHLTEQISMFEESLKLTPQYLISH